MREQMLDRDVVGDERKVVAETERAVVSSDSTPSSTRHMTASAVMPLRPLAVANWVSGVFDRSLSRAEPVGALEHELPAAIDPNGAREARLSGNRVDVAPELDHSAERYRHVQDPDVVPQASCEETEHGTIFKADGWYVLNARDARWYHVDGRGAHCDFEGDAESRSSG